MALTVDYQKFGTTFSGAYVKVMNAEYANSVETTWEMSEDPTVPPTMLEIKRLKVSFTAKVFVSDSSEDVLHQETYYFVAEDGDDIVGACYDHLKSLDAFASAVDA
jgi:hypothetical protein